MTDDIDSEQLQTTFDLAIAAIHDVAVSWVTPAVASGSRRNTQKELEEYLKRPPRLGVGASLSASTMSSQETMRLKSQLSGKNKKKRQHEDVSKSVESGDEEDSRAGAITKKVKKDPFAASVPVSSRINQGQASAQLRNTGEVSANRRDKKRNKKKTQTDPTDINDGAHVNLSTSMDQDHQCQSSPNLPVQGPHQSSYVIESPISTVPSTYPTLVTHVMDIASKRLTEVDTKPPAIAQPTSVLNLDEPPEGDNPSHLPKKKRKRRKKKGTGHQDPVTSNV